MIPEAELLLSAFKKQFSASQVMLYSVYLFILGKWRGFQLSRLLKSSWKSAPGSWAKDGEVITMVQRIRKNEKILDTASSGGVVFC